MLYLGIIYPRIRIPIIKMFFIKLCVGYHLSTGRSNSYSNTYFIINLISFSFNAVSVTLTSVSQ